MVLSNEILKKKNTFFKIKIMRKTPTLKETLFQKSLIYFEDKKE